MPVVATDDEARGLRYIFLGPNGYRLVEWTIPQWMTALVTLVAVEVLVYAFRPGDAIAWLILSLAVLPVPFLAAKKVRALTSPERGAAHQVATLASEVTTPRRSPGSTTTVTQVREGLFDDYHQEPTR